MSQGGMGVSRLLHCLSRAKVHETAHRVTRCLFWGGSAGFLKVEPKRPQPAVPLGSSLFFAKRHAISAGSLGPVKGLISEVH
jgi:hypothetical protein